MFKKLASGQFTVIDTIAKADDRPKRFSQLGGPGSADSLPAWFLNHGTWVDFGAGETLLRPDDTSCQIYHISEGWLFRQRHLMSGSVATTATYVPGDFINLGCITEPAFAETVLAMTHVKGTVLSAAKLRTAIKENPSLAFGVMRRMTADSDWLREALASIGQMQSRDRILTYIYQTYRRLVANGVVKSRASQFSLPLMQKDLAPVIGITYIHVNRSISTLRSDGILTFAKGEISILDFDRFEFEALRLLA